MGRTIAERWPSPKLTKYDGKLVPSDQVTDPTWTRSLNYKGFAVDGRGDGAYSQMENKSLGHIANHLTRRSVAKYSHRLCRAHVSGYGESIFLTARRDGVAWTEITANYTSGSAERDHNIPRVHVVPGGDNIDAKVLANLSPLVQAGAQVLRNQCGFDVNRVCGHGSYGAVFAVSYKGESFAVKLCKAAYSGQSTRLEILVEAALLDFVSTRHPRAAAIGPFAPRLRRWNECPAVLINVDGQRLAAVAMELADCSARDIFHGLGERFRAVDYHDSHENQCLLREVVSVLKGILTVVLYMHETDLAHGDLKPGNILLRKLTLTPLDPLVAHCTVQGQIYQILVCDFGHARWSGKGEKATHVFSAAGTKHVSHEIDELAMAQDPVVGVGLRELQVAFGLNHRSAHHFRHPGLGTEWIQAPACHRVFEIGEGVAQRRFDQAGDIWAVGAACARLMAAPRFSRKVEQEMRAWKTRLIESSRRSFESGQAAVESAAKRLKVASRLPLYGSNRAVGFQAAAAAAAAAQPSPSIQQPELWLEAMVSLHYADDPGEFLRTRITGVQGEWWRLLLDVVQNLLSHSSEERLHFAAKALQHPFFVRLQNPFH